MISYRKIALYSFLVFVAFAIFLTFPNKASATTYATGGIITSTNVLASSGTATISSLRYTASAIPSGTSLKMQISYDGGSWFDVTGLLDGWSVLSTGTNTVDLTGLHWTRTLFYYRIWFVSDGTATPVLDDVSVAFTAFSGTYYTYSTSGTLTSTDLLASTTVSAINSFGYSVSFLPANTGITAQFSQDASAWYSSAGVLNNSDALSVGTSTINLSALAWSGPHFYYRAVFTSDGNNTPVLDSASFTYTITEPNAPTAVSATVGDAQISLGWTAPAFNGGAAITDYAVEYKMTATSTWATFNDGVSVSTSSIVTGLTNGSSYDFRVSAVNSNGQGTASATATATPVSPNTAPVASLTTPSQSSTSSVSFTAVFYDADSNVTSSTVEYSTNNTTWASSTLGSVTASVGTVSTSTGSISSIDTNTSTTTLTIVWNIGTDLPSTTDTSVYLRITPHDGTVSGSTQTSSAFLVDTTTPSIPTNRGYNPDSFSQISISWTSSDSTFITENITTGTTEYTSSSPATFSGLSCGNSYSFRVKSGNLVGNYSDFSAPFNGLTGACLGGGGGGSPASEVSTPVPVSIAPVYASAPVPQTQQEQLNNLLAQLQMLQTALSQLQSSGSPVTTTKQLQKYLNTHGFQVSSSGAGSPGHETKIFGSLTKAALIKFQISKGIIKSAKSDGAGVFGPKTRAAMNGL